MDGTILRCEIAHLLSNARVKAERLSALTGDEALLYFIRMSILEVLAQQADVMEIHGTLIMEEQACRPCVAQRNGWDYKVGDVSSKTFGQGEGRLQGPGGDD